MVKKSIKDTYFAICPKCGSINVYHDLSKDMMAWGASTRWLCKDCDYSATPFPQVQKSKIQQFRNNIKNRTEEQENVINAPSISKGFLNRKLNRWFALFYIVVIFSIILLVFSEAYKGQNYTLMIISFIVLFGFIIVLREHLR